MDKQSISVYKIIQKSDITTKTLFIIDDKEVCWGIDFIDDKWWNKWDYKFLKKVFYK